MEKIELFEKDTVPFRPPIKNDSRLDDDGLFDDWKMDDIKFDDDLTPEPTALPVKATEQLEDEAKPPDIVETMGRPRRIIENTSGVCSGNALDLATALHSRGPSVTRCILAGNFIFGDMILAVADLIGPVTLKIATLSFSTENVDAIYTGFHSGKIAGMDFITSDFFYQHYKWTEWRMLVTSVPRDRCRFAVARTHAKVVIVTPVDAAAPAWVIEGSANLRSSQNVEQITVSIGDPEAARFHSKWMGRIIEKFELRGREQMRISDVWAAISGR